MDARDVTSSSLSPLAANKRWALNMELLAERCRSIRSCRLMWCLTVIGMCCVDITGRSGANASFVTTSKTTTTGGWKSWKNAKSTSLPGVGLLSMRPVTSVDDNIHRGDADKRMNVRTSNTPRRRATSRLAHEFSVADYYDCNDDERDIAVEGSDEEFRMPSAETPISELAESQRGIGVGIDLGTTNSAVSIFSEDGIPRLIPIDGESTMPSVVSVSAVDGKPRIVVGNGCLRDTDSAESSSGTYTYRHVKRVMGMGVSSAASNAEVVPHLLQTASQRRKGRAVSKKNRDEGGAALNLQKMLADARQNPVRLALPDAFRNLPRPHSDSDTTADATDATLASSIYTASPEDISAIILKKLFHTAQQATGETITRAVVGVPAYFNDEQREATIKATITASKIPRPRIRLLREPEAAALAYGIGKAQIERSADDDLILVFDLGGGTFDVSILGVGGGIYEVLATGGNNMLGGSDFDAEIARRVFSRLVGQFGGGAAGGGANAVNYWKEGGDVAALMVKAAEMVRIALSNTKELVLSFPSTGDGWLKLDQNGRLGDIIVWKTNQGDAHDRDKYKSIDNKGTLHGSNILCRITRKEMELMCADQFQALLRPVREVAILAGVLLPGDSSPAAVQAALDMEDAMDDTLFDSFFDPDTGQAKEDNNDDDDIDSDMLLKLKDIELAEKKRAQQKGRKRARNLQQSERKFRKEKRMANERARSKNDNTPASKVQDGINGRPLNQVVLVGGATRMPAIGRLLAALTGVVPQRTVNPDEAVALGCGVQVGILDGIHTDLQVISPIEAAMLRALAKKKGM